AVVVAGEKSDASGITGEVTFGADLLLGVRCRVFDVEPILRQRAANASAGADDSLEIALRSKLIESGDDRSARKGIELGKLSGRRKSRPRLQTADKDLPANLCVQPAIGRSIRRGRRQCEAKGSRPFWHRKWYS